MDGLPRQFFRGCDHSRGGFDDVFRPPRLESIQELLANNPDVTVGGGVRRLEESDDSALVFGISIPFPVFDRNQGARKAARLRRSKVRSQEQAEVLRAAGDLTVAHLALVTSHDAVVELREEMLSQADSGN